jgi:hypothetical protein
MIGQPRWGRVGWPRRWTIGRPRWWRIGRPRWWRIGQPRRWRVSQPGRRMVGRARWWRISPRRWRGTVGRAGRWVISPRRRWRTVGRPVRQRGVSPRRRRWAIGSSRRMASRTWSWSDGKDGRTKQRAHCDQQCDQTALLHMSLCVCILSVSALTRHISAPGPVRTLNLRCHFASAEIKTTLRCQQSKERISVWVGAACRDHQS